MWAMPGCTGNVTGGYQAGKQRPLLAACRQHTQLRTKLTIENDTSRFIHGIHCYDFFYFLPVGFQPGQRRIQHRAHQQRPCSHLQ